MTMYERTVITTRRKQREAEGATREFPFGRKDVATLSAKNGEPVWFADRRMAAWETYESTPFPTLSDEPWRRTDIRPLRRGDLTLTSVNGSGVAETPAELLSPLVGNEHGGQIVIRGQEITNTGLAEGLRQKGVIFTDFITAVREHGELLQKYLGRAVKPEEGKFASLAGALVDTGIFLYVPRNVELSLPLHSVIWAPGVREGRFTHVLVVVEDGGSLTYVHETASPTEVEGQALHAGIVELLVGQAARLTFVELQSWGHHVWNFTHERCRIGRDSQIDWIFGAVGSHLTKNFTTLDLDGQGSTGRMSGFYFADGEQHLDHDTQQNHNAPNTTSDLLFKGALKDRSRSVWQGMIYVAPGAQKADGYQANRNLNLSSQARADSIPGLEILADDVRCTHGATVGQLEEEPIFYLMSRGLPRTEAERMVVDGFFDPVMQRIPFEGVRERLKQAIVEKMG